MILRRRQSFPGDNPQEIRCPECGGKARTSEDGIIWVCEEGPTGHTGYYEQPAGAIIDDSYWRL